MGESSAAFGVLVGRLASELFNGGTVPPLELALAAQYGELSEKTDAVRMAREALLDAGSVPARSEANAALGSACDALVPLLEQQLTDADKISALKDYSGIMSNTARLIETSGYNELVSEFRSNVLGLFPVNVLYRIAGVTVPDYF